jgi:hypothetical protein
MSGIKNHSLLQQRELIKADYINNMGTVEQLAEKWNISVNTLQDWVKVGRYGDAPWGLLKKEKQVAMKRDLMDRASVHLPGAFKTGAEIVDYGFAKIRDRLVSGACEGRELEIVRSTAEVMCKLYKILRLDENKSTSNVAVASDKGSTEATKELKDYMSKILGEEIELED